MKRFLTLYIILTLSFFSNIYAKNERVVICLKKREQITAKLENIPELYAKEVTIIKDKKKIKIPSDSIEHIHFLQPKDHKAYTITITYTDINCYDKNEKHKPLDKVWLIELNKTPHITHYVAVSKYKIKKESLTIYSSKKEEEDIFESYNWHLLKRPFEKNPTLIFAKIWDPTPEYKYRVINYGNAYFKHCPAFLEFIKAQEKDTDNFDDAFYRISDFYEKLCIDKQVTTRKPTL